KEKEPLVLSLDNPYNSTNESNMNIDEQVEYITSATDEKGEKVLSNDLKMDEEPKTESLCLISRMKTPSDPLATMYSTSNHTTNPQGKDEDGFTL
ncbi:10299_t:CDS:2, partial [Cetraspora pellucida]